MNNENYHEFRIFLAFSHFFLHFFSSISVYLPFLEHFREIPAKIDEILAENGKLQFWKEGMKWNEICSFHHQFGWFFPKFWDLSGAKDCKSCRSRKMLKTASTLAIVAVHTEENEPPKIWRPAVQCFNPILSLHPLQRASENARELTGSRRTGSTPRATSGTTAPSKQNESANRKLMRSCEHQL